MSVEGSPDALGGGGRHVSHWGGVVSSVQVEDCPFARSSYMINFLPLL